MTDPLARSHCVWSRDAYYRGEDPMPWCPIRDICKDGVCRRRLGGATVWDSEETKARARAAFAAEP